MGGGGGADAPRTARGCWELEPAFVQDAGGCGVLCVRAPWVGGWVGGKKVDQLWVEGELMPQDHPGEAGGWSPFCAGCRWVWKLSGWLIGWLVSLGRCTGCWVVTWVVMLGARGLISCGWRRGRWCPRSSPGMRGAADLCRTHVVWDFVDAHVLGERLGWRQGADQLWMDEGGLVSHEQPGDAGGWSSLL